MEQMVKSWLIPQSDREEENEEETPARDGGYATDVDEALKAIAGGVLGASAFTGSINGITEILQKAQKNELIVNLTQVRLLKISPNNKKEKKITSHLNVPKQF